MALELPASAGVQVAAVVLVVGKVLPPGEESQPGVEAAGSPLQARPLAGLGLAPKASGNDVWGPSPDSGR